MTVTTTKARKQYSGSATPPSEFAVDFKFNASSDLVVVLTDSDGDDTTLTETTHFTVTGAGDDEGGTVEITDADYRPGIGEYVTIERKLNLTQAVDLITQGGFYPSVHEDEFDVLTMLIQQQQEAIDRCLQYDATTEDDDIDTDISAAIDARDAAVVAQTAAELAETNAETAEANAEAALAAAGLPGSLVGAADKMLVVKDDASGYELQAPAAARTNLGLGTAAVEDVGTGAGNVVQLDGSAKLPAVDGSQLTNTRFDNIAFDNNGTPATLTAPRIECGVKTLTYAAVNSVTEAVTFASAFTTLASVTTSFQTSTGNRKIQSVLATSLATTGFNLQGLTYDSADVTGTVTVRWIAIGTD